MEHVLLVVGEPSLGRELQRLLLEAGHSVTLATALEAGLTHLAAGHVDLVIVALPPGSGAGIATTQSIRAGQPRIPIITISDAGSAQEAIEVTKAGAFEYLVTPLDGAELLETVAAALEAGRLMRSPVALDTSDVSPGGDALIGRSRPMREVYKAIGKVADTDATVLLRGESGTGKELVARAVYQHSRRAEGPFVVVNCVAIPETLLESELFGHEKGAFTGAASRRVGKVEQADGGTLFLDEIGDMPLAIQAKLLRLLQDTSIERIGGRHPVQVDVRIIAATNRDLEAAMAEGRFRADLFYRLDVVTITLPPLRERREDVPLLCDYFLERLTLELGVRNPGLSPEAYELLACHTWPGNVRELANALEKCLILCHGRRIGALEVSTLVLGSGAAPPGPMVAVEDAVKRWTRQSVAGGREDLLAELVEHVSRKAIAEVLRQTGGNRSRAARILGISRPTLLKHLARHSPDRGAVERDETEL